MDYSVVVPVYRGAATLGALHERITRFFDTRKATFELILVDDGSRDDSWKVIRELAARDPRVLGIQLHRNFGQHNATAAGIRAAQGRFIVTLDEDLQHPPEEIGRLIEHQAATGADVVYGIPSKRHHALWRRAASRLVMLIPRHVMGIAFDISSFRLMTASATRAIREATRHDLIVDICLTWVTTRIAAVEIAHAADQRGGSTYTIRKLLAVLFNLLCGYTILPLRLAVLAGSILSCIAFFFGLRAIYWKVTNNIDIEGYTSLIVATTFTGGLILIGLGIASEYIARIFMHINGKPQSVIRGTTRDTTP